MIVPSIDIINGQAVQLRHGREVMLTAGDPIAIAEKFSRVGEIAVIDLDAAMSTGSNEKLIKEMCGIAPCRVGGGIRSIPKAEAWLNAGARRVILGTAANAETLSALPRDRVIAALDGVNGQVVVDGWRRKTGQSVIDQVRSLRDYAGGFLVTFVEREGALGGTDLAAAGAIREAAGAVPVTVAGGITTPEEIWALDESGLDAQVGMAIYTGRMTLANSLACLLHSDREDGLWPTVVVDEQGIALGLVYSSATSLHQAIETGQGVYHSRKRGIWTKGESSGNTQQLVRIDLDCDRDALRFTVRQHGNGFCHTGTRTCWGDVGGLQSLEEKLRDRIRNASASSYTQRLASDPGFLRAKLIEEAGELADAVRAGDASAVRHEASDLMYFLTVALAAGGASHTQIASELDHRALAVSHRHGEIKRPRGCAPEASSGQEQP